MAMRHPELQKRFEAVSGTQYVRCVQCGAAKIKNQGLALLAHIAICPGGPTK